MSPRPDRAFERLYRRHVAAIYRYVLVVLQNEADAEDATQQTFLSAYRAWERGERPRRPHNWLITIAHNVCRQRFRESARRPNEVDLDEAALTAAVPDDEAPAAADIRRALGHISFNQRAALVMRELEGRPYKEIGDVLGVSHSAVETLLFRARRALREQLEGDLTCGQAEEALSQRLDRTLSLAERSRLRAHLRECPECAALERSQRARRAALRGLATLPLPQSLVSFGGPAVAGAGAGVAAKAAAVAAVGLFAAGAGQQALDRPSEPSVVRPAIVEQSRPAVRERAVATSRPVRAAKRPAAAPGARRTQAPAARVSPVGGRRAEPEPEQPSAPPASETPASSASEAAAQAPTPAAIPVTIPATGQEPAVPVAVPQTTTPAPPVSLPQPPVSVPVPEVTVPPAPVPLPPAPVPLPPVPDVVEDVTDTVEDLVGGLPVP